MASVISDWVAGPKLNIVVALSGRSAGVRDESPRSSIRTVYFKATLSKS